MTTLREIVQNRRSGVYRSASAPSTATREVPATVQRITIPAVRNKAALMAAFASAAELPDWFGSNWDSLEECLQDLRAPHHGGVLVELSEPAVLARHDADAWRTTLAVLGDVSEAWQARGGLFVVLVEGEAPGIRDLPVVAPG
jgi:hypothetical protein